MDIKKQIEEIAKISFWIDNFIYEECRNREIPLDDLEWDEEEFALVPDEDWDNQFDSELEEFNKLVQTEEFQKELVDKFYEDFPEYAYLWDLENCKFTVVEKTLKSCEASILVRCERKTNYIDFWVDCWRSSKKEDWEIDWNQYIFWNNENDNLRNDLQSNCCFASEVFGVAMDELY